MSQPIIRRETDEMRGFRDGLKYAKLRKAVMDYHKRGSALHRKLAYIYRGDVPPQVAYMKQGLDYWRGMALFALRPPSNISLYQFALLKIIELNDTLDGFHNVPEVMVNKALEGYAAFVESDPGSGPGTDFMESDVEG